MYHHVLLSQHLEITRTENVAKEIKRDKIKKIEKTSAITC
jgi:hypothetical protein